MPSGEGPFPAVLQVGGSGREGTNNPSARAHATRLAWKGIATLIYDKRGVGESGGIFYNADFRRTVEDIHAGYEFLKAHAEINASKLGYLGHSEGGALMPQVLSERSDIKFAFARVAPVLGYQHTLRYQFGGYLANAGLTEDEANDFLNWLDDEGEYFEKSVDNPDYHRGAARTQLQNRLNDFIKQHGQVITQRFVRQVGIIPYNARTVERIAYYQLYPGAAYYLPKTSKIPMYYAYGGADENVDTDSSVTYLRTFRQNTHSPIDIKIYDGENHAMHKKAYLLIGGFVPGYLDDMSDWMAKQVAALN
jgi:dienelactone hydrolase